MKNVQWSVRKIFYQVVHRVAGVKAVYLLWHAARRQVYGGTKLSEELSLFFYPKVHVCVRASWSGKLHLQFGVESYKMEFDTVYLYMLSKNLDMQSKDSGRHV